MLADRRNAINRLIRYQFMIQFALVISRYTDIKLEATNGHILEGVEINQSAIFLRLLVGVELSNCWSELPRREDMFIMLKWKNRSLILNMHVPSMFGLHPITHLCISPITIKAVCILRALLLLW